MRNLFVLVFIALSQVFLAAHASKHISDSELRDLAIAPVWHFGMESTIPSKPTINPAVGEFKLDFKGERLTGVMRYEYNGSLGYQKAGAKGYFRNQQFVVALSHPDGPLVLTGKFTGENKIEGKATMNGKAYAKFHMSSKGSPEGGNPIVFCLDMDPPPVAGASTKLVLDRAAGDVVGSASTHVELGGSKNSSGVTWFKGGAKGRIYNRQVSLKFLDARGNACTLAGDFDAGERVYRGTFDSPSGDGYFCMYLDDGTTRFTDPATASDWQLEFTPPWEGARVTIRPIISLERTASKGITGTGSYRLGWCGNERPTQVTITGTWDQNNRVELWIAGPTPIHFRGSLDRVTRHVIGSDDAGRTVTMKPTVRTALKRWK